jgi:hypothetical protein
MGSGKAVRLYSLISSRFLHILHWIQQAPGFQTSVRQIRVTPEIAARLRRGEQVSPEEIAEASARADKEKREPVIEINEEKSSQSEPVNEWLPDSITNPQKRGKAKKR